MDWRTELPWLLLLASALVAPLLVHEQGGDWHSAVTAGLACLVAPGAAVEAMLALGRLALRCEAPKDPPRVTGRDRRR